MRPDAERRPGLGAAVQLIDLDDDHRERTGRLALGSFLSDEQRARAWVRLPEASRRAGLARCALEHIENAVGLLELSGARPVHTIAVRYLRVALRDGRAIAERLNREAVAVGARISKRER